MRKVTQEGKNKLMKLKTPQEVWEIWEKIWGIWKRKKTDPIKYLKKIRREWKKTY